MKVVMIKILFIVEFYLDINIYKMPMNSKFRKF